MITGTLMVVFGSLTAGFLVAESVSKRNSYMVGFWTCFIITMGAYVFH